MRKDNILFTVIGLLVGLIIGFIGTNSINRNAMVSQNSAPTQPNLPTQNQPHQSAAVPEVNEAIAKADQEPNNFDAQIKVGEMFARINNYEKALIYFEKAEKIKPGDYQLWVILGNLNFQIENFDKAAVWYEKALAKKNDDIAVRTDYGITFMERSQPDYDRAIKEFQTSLTLNPNHQPTIYNMAVAYFKKGNLKEANDLKAKLKDNTDLTKKLEAVFASS